MNNNKKIINIIYVFNISLCLFLLAYGLVCGISGNDFFWHVKTGEWIFNNKQIPTTDVFSWYASANNYTWYAHEWLSDIIYFLIYKFIGLTGICVFAIFCTSLSNLLLMKCTESKWSKYPLFAFFWFLYNIASFSSIIQCRPYIFSFIFLNIELYLLYKLKENKNYKGIYFIPIIAILWANMHGGSSNLSYLLILVFLLAGILPTFNFHRLENNKLDKNVTKKLGITFVFTILANCINPHGIGLVTYPYVYMGGERFDLKVISEWQAIDLKTSIGIFFIISLVLLAIFLVISKKQINIINFLLFGAFAYLTLKSIRFEFLFFIVATYIIFDYIPEEINKIGEEKFLKGLALLFSVLIFGLSCIMIFKSDYVYIKRQLNEEIIETIKNSDNEKLFNFYDYGEELIFNEIPVFIDSRADLYSLNGNLMQESWAMWNLDNSHLDDYERIIDINYYFDELYKFDSVLIPSFVSLNVYLEQRDDFEKVYEDEGVIYWERIE
jgi:hypothetical protein